MTLIVEDGTGLLASESYSSVAQTDTYHSNRGNTLWSTLGTSDKEAALRKATDYMVEVYRPLWKGYRVLTTQRLDFPRTLVYISNEILNNVTPLDLTKVPVEIQNACSILALKSITDDLLVDMEQQILKESIGSLTTEYQPSSSSYKHYSSVEAMLKPFLKSSSSTVMR